jgi:hypothetical protein
MLQILYQPCISNVIAYIACNTRNKKIYGLGVGISIDFKIFSNFLFLGGGVDPRGHI